VSLVSAALLLLFALAMTASGNPRSALDYPVLSAAAALLLGVNTKEKASRRTAATL
jgi:hypothetical protein